MPDFSKTTVDRVLDELRAEAGLRRESLGPIIEAVAMLRACCETMRLLLEEVDCSIGVHLELLDAVLRAHHGNRWWEAGEQ